MLGLVRAERDGRRDFMMAHPILKVAVGQPGSRNKSNALHPVIRKRPRPEAMNEDKDKSRQKIE
ncbi:hypothetical protein MEA186_24442 [Mesorhizobium amorphae CCNWGS0123]|uniref:Uncharacterized protein n=1 Tax=Mesorhizobium amorphae CCNWGS0123 TaxID=1082933 RepID=G6YFY4_9HYPH|nr:hypothetical protein A6B35_30270 [Mesorhizobium amorphae CCNWGS0123]EHH09338.1 hypothetical protein MEA186_24442 [Mesorhizobium amorphae CCNWGS0123]